MNISNFLILYRNDYDRFIYSVTAPKMLKLTIRADHEDRTFEHHRVNINISDLFRFSKRNIFGIRSLNGPFGEHPAVRNVEQSPTGILKTASIE